MATESGNAPQTAVNEADNNPQSQNAATQPAAPAAPNPAAPPKPAATPATPPPAAPKKKSFLETEATGNEDPLLQLAKSLQNWVNKHQDMMGAGKFMQDKALQALGMAKSADPVGSMQTFMDKTRDFFNTLKSSQETSEDNLDLIEDDAFNFDDDDIADMQTNNATQDYLDLMDDDGFNFDDDDIADMQTNNATQDHLDLMDDDAFNFSDDDISDMQTNHANTKQTSDTSFTAGLSTKLDSGDDYFTSASSHNAAISSAFSSDSDDTLSVSADSAVSAAPAA